MTTRLSVALGNEANQITVCTYHALAFRYEGKGKKLLSYKQKAKIISTLTEEIAQEQYNKSIHNSDPHSSSYRGKSKINIDEITQRYIQQLPLTAYQSHILMRYMQKLDFQRLFSYDILMIKFLQHLQKEDAFRTSLQQKYRFILIDECQDNNRIQYQITKLLSGQNEPQRHKKQPCNVFFVGDDDQIIYSFLGASPNGFQALQRSYPDMQLLSLKYNYRSHPEIIRHACSLIRHNRFRLQKEILPGIHAATADTTMNATANATINATTNSTVNVTTDAKMNTTAHTTADVTADSTAHATTATTAHTGKQQQTVHALSFTDTISKNTYIRHLFHHHTQDLSTSKKPLTIAVLYRNKYYITSLLLSLIQNNIPFSLNDPFLLTDIEPIKTIHSMLCCLSGISTKNDWKRLLKQEIPFLSDTQANNILSAMRENLDIHTSIRQAFRNFPTSGTLHFQNQLRESFQSRLTALAHKTMHASLCEKINMICDYYAIQSQQSHLDIESTQALDTYLHLAKECHDLPSFIHKLTCLSRSHETTTTNTNTGTSTDSSTGISTDISTDISTGISTSTTSNAILTLSTIHSSKGKEFDIVIMDGMEDKILPSKNATTPQQQEEERRVCYVGMTRAIKQLYMLHCHENGTPSPYFAQLHTLANTI